MPLCNCSMCPSSKTVRYKFCWALEVAPLSQAGETAGQAGTGMVWAVGGAGTGVGRAEGVLSCSGDRHLGNGSFGQPRRVIRSRASAVKAVFQVGQNAEQEERLRAQPVGHSRLRAGVWGLGAGHCHWSWGLTFSLLPGPGSPPAGTAPALPDSGSSSP